MPNKIQKHTNARASFLNCICPGRLQTYGRHTKHTWRLIQTILCWYASVSPGTHRLYISLVAALTSNNLFGHTFDVQSRSWRWTKKRKGRRNHFPEISYSFLRIHCDQIEANTVIVHVLLSNTVALSPENGQVNSLKAIFSLLLVPGIYCRLLLATAIEQSARNCSAPLSARPLHTPSKNDTAFFMAPDAAAWHGLAQRAAGCSSSFGKIKSRRPKVREKP